MAQSHLLETSHGGLYDPQAPLALTTRSSAPPQVLGLEALRTREAAAQHKLLIEHMSKLRSLHQLNRATFVLGLESNLG